MSLTRGEAYDILELPVGADHDSIRTSYKRLALRWHPDKHNNSQDSVQKFQQISKAYKRLIADNGGDFTLNMNLDQMMQLFKDVFFTRTVNSFNGSGYNTSDDEEDDDDDDEDDDDTYIDDIGYSNIFPDKFRLNKDKKARAGGDSSYKNLSVDEINKNAEELITEEEKEKRRAEKRKAKKKRRREKKKMEKQQESVESVVKDDKKSKTKNKDSSDSHYTEKNTKHKKPDKKGDSSSSDETGFDPNSAFFTKVVNKKKKVPVVTEGGGRQNRKHDSGEETEDLDPVVLRSRQLAIKGNEMAQLGHYNAAIELFSEAIKLDPHDFRFFGNRSYCYDRIQQYDRALKDAEKAISLSKEWPKGYFRKGRALAGLRMFSEAEDAFTQVLKLDKNCDDAVQELLRVRIFQITEMGFSRAQAEQAIKIHGTVQSALDSLLAGVAENALGGEVYVSDDESGFSAPSLPKQQQKKTLDTKMDYRNPEGLTALWVGNVLPDKVDDKKLLKIFSKYGPVTSVRCLPDKFCAFINYKTKEAASKAMQYLQGAECGGQKLLIKFPDNPIVNGGGNFTIRKTVAPSQQKQTFVGKAVSQFSQPPSTSAASMTVSSQPSVNTAVNEVMSHLSTNGANQLKQSGPVNGDECYFWRTTGCTFGDKCRNKHIPDHKGVDKKPWQKTAK